MLPIVKQIATEFKAELVKLYGDELSDLILFGSHARGDFHDESDIDFAVVLKDPETRGAPNIFKISPISSVLGIKYLQMISTFPISNTNLKNSNRPIYREIRKDGVYI